MRVEVLGIDRSNILEAGSLTVSRVSKERRSASLNLFSAASSWLPNAGQEIKIYDDSDNLIFGGVIKRVGISHYDSGNSNTTPVLSSIDSNGYQQITEKRTAVAAYTTSYAGAIVTDLLTNVLNLTGSSEKVLAGTIENGAYFETYAKERAYVKELLDDLAGASGFKWYIDDQKTLYFMQESSTPDAAHSLLSTGTFYDFHNFEVQRSVDNYRNVQYVIGDRDSCTGEAVVATAQSTEQRAAQLAIEGGSCYGSGAYANIIRDSSVKTTIDAQAVADNALKQAMYPETISFDSYQTDWQPSTKLRVKLPKYGIDTDAYYLIEEVTMQKVTSNELVTHITASKRDPSSFSSQKTEDDIDFMTKIAKWNSMLTDMNINLGSLAYEDMVEAARLGVTIIDGGYIRTGLISASNIDTGTLSAARIASNSITAEKLLIGTFDNLLENAGFEQQLTGWSNLSTTLVLGTALPHTGNYYLVINSDGSLKRAYTNQKIEVVEGDTYFISGWYRSASANGTAAIGLNYYDKDDTYFAGSSVTCSPSTSWTEASKEVVLPSNTKYIRAIISVAATSTTGAWAFDDLYVKKKMSGDLIVDGTITAAKIDVSDLAAEKIRYAGDDTYYGIIGDFPGIGKGLALYDTSYSTSQVASYNMMSDHGFAFFDHNNVQRVSVALAGSFSVQDESSTVRILSSDSGGFYVYDDTGETRFYTLNTGSFYVLNSGNTKATISTVTTSETVLRTPSATDNALGVNDTGVFWILDGGTARYLPSRIDEKTSVSCGTNSSYWIKIARITLTSQYVRVSARISVMGNPSTGGLQYYADILIGVLQQAAMGSAPVGRVYVHNGVNITTAEVTACIVQNDAADTIIDLYVKAVHTYRQVTTRIVNYEGSGVLDMTPGSSWVATLPSTTTLTTY